MKKIQRLIVFTLCAIMTLTMAACAPAATPAPAAPAAEPAPAPAAPAPAEPAPAPAAPEPAAPAEPAPAEPAASGYELALVTDIGTIDDKSFNQGSWEGLVQYATENNITHQYYKPPEQSTDSYLSTIELAVRGGAKLVVCPGFLFEEAIFLAQDQFPDTMFVLIDGAPHNADYTEYRTEANVVGITYAEEEAGFLAGYAAVKDGNTALGFMGGMAVPAVVRYGYGFIQGAEYAAQELGLGANSVAINYHYMGNFDASPEAQTFAASWYQAGTEIIFGCGGGVGNSVMAAAEQAGTKVIGVDVDQSGESATVITSSMKGLRESVYDSIKNYYAGTFPGGQGLIFDAANNGVALPMATSKFETFTQADYDAIFAKLANNEIALMKDADDAGRPPDDEGRTMHAEVLALVHGHDPAGFARLSSCWRREVEGRQLEAGVVEEVGHLLAEEGLAGRRATDGLL